MADIDEASSRGFARTMAGFWSDRLGDKLLGVYLMGSLAHGGFSTRYSDIDMAVIAADGLAEDDRAAMQRHAETLSPPHAEKLSLFWSDRTFATGRFPPLDRIDYLDHRVALVEHERVEPQRPPLAAIRAWLGGIPLANWLSEVRRFAIQPAFDASARKPYLRAHLYPARFVYSWATGAMGSNDAAVAYLRAHPPQGIELGPIEEALRCRQTPADPEALFAERGKLLLQAAAVSRVVAASTPT